MKRLTATLAVASLFGPVGGVQAVRQYRCGDRVQYRPCETPSAFPAAHRVPKRPALVKRPATVRDAVFRDLGGGRGEWSGIVAGDGYVVVTLRIEPKGLPPHSWVLGGVELNGRSTDFRFVTDKPSGPRWGWRLTAHTIERAGRPS